MHNIAEMSFMFFLHCKIQSQGEQLMKEIKLRENKETTTKHIWASVGEWHLEFERL